MKLFYNSSFFDYTRRIKFNKLESFYLLRKAIILNQFLPINIRSFFFFQKHFKKSRIRNFCRLTGKSRTVFKLVGLSRMPFRHLMAQRILSGFKRFNR
jgi:ribosomal protein S14